MKIECSYDKIIKLKDLKEHPDNPNEHPQEQIELLAEIMLKNNIRKPITVSNLSGYIISGHCRYLAAKHNGWDEFPVDFQNYESEAKELEDLTADNKIQELSEFNMSKMNFIFDKNKTKLDLKLCAMPNFIINSNKKLVQFEANTDINKEWEGMPEFEQDDKTSFRQIIVHFEKQQDVDKFFSIINQKFTDKTKSIWYPEQERMDHESKRY